MAALYLHNAIFIPEPSETHSPEYFPHSRTLSSTTLRTTTTEQSHPTEPLLHSTNSGSLAYQDLLSRQPGYPDGQSEQWTTALSLDGYPTPSKERQEYWEHSVKKLQILKRIRLVLKVVLGALLTVISLWALYNTVRYFIAYTIYDSVQGQTIAIVLGTSTAVCFAFLICAAAVSAFQPHLVRAHIPIHSLLVMRTIFRYFAAFFLLAPTIVNLVLVIIWRRSSISELVPALRCRLDADVVWSITTGTCNRTTPAQWLGLSIFRVIFTLIVIVLFLLISSAYDGTRRPSQSLQRRRRRRRRIQSDQSMPKSPPMSASSEVPLNPGHSSRHSSHSGVPFQLQGSNRTADRSFRSSEASSMLHSSSSEDDESTDSSRLDQSRLTFSSTPTLSPQNDRELNNFAERFRSLVSQISRETDEALRFAQSEDANSSEPALLPEDIYTDFPRHTYDDFTGAEYPQDDHVRILNGFVRRMPTIESLGSRELTSLASSQDRLHSLSRPPTRSVTEFTGSEPPSRANSLSLTAAIGGHGLTSTEMGELMDKIDKENNSMGTGSGSQSASRSTFSYYTAPSVGRTSDSPVPLTPSSDQFPSSPTSGHSSSL
ncbi:hypothetical protein DFH05DRAFT_1401060 [Lentinula detonsa]|uniref:Uncharacterized protein n=1 Tax=Lentinula detonsa TaxID=2804962 RepID=A0A9W8NXH6_9AGAR|nr:hypothetical protein DFH05DRAFT_1401060 [Lentinula detonsa]